MSRVHKPEGKLVMIPFVNRECVLSLKMKRLRALCLSVAFPRKNFVEVFADAGIGTIERWAGKPNRIINRAHSTLQSVINRQEL